MEDRELLVLAAKAARIGPVLCYESARNCLRIGDRNSYRLWRPLQDEIDALRLAVALGLEYSIDRLPSTGTMKELGSPVRVRVWGLGWHKIEVGTLGDPDVLSAIKMCFVLVAARIGKAMP